MAFKKLACLALSFALIGASCVALYAKEKEKESANQLVDSGSFSVMKNGLRVATEKFSVQKNASGSTITAQLQAGAENDVSQSSELKISAAGDLVHYEWHNIAPTKADLVVTPNDQFLIERITVSAEGKRVEQPFLMPASTMILDNNSFVQREVLAWRYLASSCKQAAGRTICPKDPAQFGVLVPQDRISMRVTLEPVGTEKIKVNGSERELLRLNLKDDSGEWALWLDDQNMFKLMRIVIAGDNTEVVRD